MTKKVRIENADTADYKVVIQTWERGQTGRPDTLVAEQVLGHPCAITGDETYITSTRYLVVREA